MKGGRPSWLRRLALGMVPERWRDSVAEDLVEEAGLHWWSPGWCALQAVAIAIPLHWGLTRTIVMSDFRYALRSLQHARGFAFGAVATFALGIGVNTAVFSAVDRMLFRTLPYDRTESLAVLREYSAADSTPYGTVPAEWVVDGRRLPAVADAATSDWNPDTYRAAASADGARYLGFVPVSYTMLRTLGVHPVVGADFTEQDAREKRRRLLISYDVWQRQFAGRRDIVGLYMWPETSTKPVAEIAGVLPENFIPPQVTLPNLDWSGLSVTDDAFDAATPSDRSTPPIVRLKPGVTVAQAQAQVDALVAGLRLEHPPGAAGLQSVARLTPLREALFGQYTTYLALVFAAATLVLLVGCANLGGLLLVRARSREHRAAIQLALGASPGRIVRTAVFESLVLAVCGCGLALVVLQLCGQAIAAWLPPIFSRYAAPVFASRVLVFAGTLSTASAAAAGVLPGWRLARVDVLSVVQRGAARVGAGRLRGSGVLIAGEVAISLVLVACAALTGRSLIGLLRTDVGFDMDRLDIVDALLPASKDTALLRQRYGGMLDVIRAMPGVEAAAGANVLPIIGAVSERFGVGVAEGQRWFVTDNFTDTLGMRRVAGRSITRVEYETQAPVGMLSESGLALVWPGVAPREAIGRFLRFPGEAPRQVVGIVSDVRGSYDQPPWPSLYVPVASTPFRRLQFAVRLSRGGLLTVADLTGRLQAAGLAPTLVRVSAVAERFDRGVVNQRFRAEMFSAFGLTALVLAVVGLYAVQSFTVALRTTEFGIRIALGATPAGLWRMLVRQTMGPVLAGIAAGAAVTYWVAQVLQAFLVHVDARDPRTYGLVATLLAVVTLAAAWAPSRRAARTDPAVVLRAS